MITKILIDYIEDKKITNDEKWYFHATNKDIKIIEEILKNGIKSLYLRNKESLLGYNGKYYVSLSKKTNCSKSAYYLFENRPKFIVSGIHTIHANNKSELAYSCIETVFPIRTSCYEDEYQAFLKVRPKYILGLEYSLSHILYDDPASSIEELRFLKEIINSLGKLSLNLPIYDCSSSREINKQKVISLNI